MKQLPAPRPPRGLLASGREAATASRTTALWAALRAVREDKTPEQLAEVLRLIQDIQSLGFEVVLYDRGRVVQLRATALKDTTWRPDQLDFNATGREAAQDVARRAAEDLARYQDLIRTLEELPPPTTKQLLRELRVASRKETQR